jgi:hypothetical protein
MSIFVKYNEPDQYKDLEEGLHSAVVVDVVDRGQVETQFGVREIVQIIFALDQNGKDGRPLLVARNFNKSLHPKSSLSNAIRQLEGRDPGTSCDLERLIGRNATLNIVLNESGGRTYPNIDAILPAQKGSPKLDIPETYVRKKDRGVQSQKPPIEARDNAPEEHPADYYDYPPELD